MNTVLIGWTWVECFSAVWMTSCVVVHIVMSLMMSQVSCLSGERRSGSGVCVLQCCDHYSINWLPEKQLTNIIDNQLTVSVVIVWLSARLRPSDRKWRDTGRRPSGEHLSYSLPIILDYNQYWAVSVIGSLALWAISCSCEELIGGVWTCRQSWGW